MASNNEELAARDHYAQGRLREALVTYKRLHQHSPGRRDLQARLGYLALLGNDLDTATTHLSRVINEGYRSREALGHLAEAYYRQGRLDSAAYCYQRLGREGLAGTLAVMAALEPYRLVQVDASIEIPWLPETPLPVITAQLNGHTANLILDTGAGDTVLDTGFAIEAGIRLGGQELRTFAGGMPGPVIYGHMEEMSLQALDIRDIPVQVFDIPPALRNWFPEMPIHGIIGTGIFARFKTTLDYQQRSLRLEHHHAPADEEPQHNADDQSGTPLWLAENQLLLTQATLAASDPGVWFIDSGMTGGAFAVPRSRIENLEVEVDENNTLTGTGGGGLVHGHKLCAPWLQLDQQRRLSPDGIVLDALPLEQSCRFTLQGLIGHDMLIDSVLTLDFPKMQLTLATGNPDCCR